MWCYIIELCSSFVVYMIISSMATYTFPPGVMAILVERDGARNSVSMTLLKICYNPKLCLPCTAM